MINKNRYNVIGIMSGTSLDGIDLIYTTIQSSDWSFKIHCAETIPYSKAWLKKLHDAMHLSSEKLQNLDKDYTDLLATITKQFIKNNAIENIDFISSHGHTILHQPDKGVTYQIGNLPKLAPLIGETVVCDFRIQDVEFGGQGAPLVPVGDTLLFNNYDYCLNLGGFANVSYEEKNMRLAFDICPVNIVMNYYCRTINRDYDDNGVLASKGNLSKALLAELNALDFYKLEPPKSLGFEWVENIILPLIDSYQLAIEDILRTFVEHVAIQISKSTTSKGSVLITGGGAYNGFLVSRIEALSSNNVVLPPKEIIEYKEALIFGLLGVLKIRGEVNCLASVTGAREDHSSGVIFTA